MANIKSQKKRILLNEKNRQRNVAVRSAIKTHTKSFVEAVDGEKGAEAVKEGLAKALSVIDRAASKGIIHRKNAAHKKSSLQRQANQALNK